jgi:hypothetical protein
MKAHKTTIAPVLLCGLFAAATAGAQPPPEPVPPEPVPVPAPPPPVPERPRAEVLRDDARAAMARGEVEPACAMLDESAKLAPNEDVLFELGQCYALAGKTAESATVYERVAAAGGARAAEAEHRAELLRKSMTPLQPEPGRPAEPAVEPRTVEGGHAFSDFVDTRLTWTIGDDDLIAPTGQRQPFSPDVSIGDRKAYRLFFDNLNSAFGGRENLTHLVLYKKMPGFIERLDTEAALVLRFDLASLASGSNNLSQSIYDAGSYIRLFLKTGEPDDEKTGVGLTLFPIDTDRFRLGYLYDISWGGTNARINQSIFPRIQGSSPGVKLQFDHPMFYVFGGMKTASIVQVQEILTPGTSEVETVRVAETNFGGLGGAGVKPVDMVTIDVGGGYFQQGTFDLPDVLGEPVYTFGLSGRAAVHSPGGGPKASIDFSLYRNDPMKADVLLKKDTYDADSVTWSVSLEYTNLWQNLKDFDATGETRLQQARAGAAQGNLKVGFFRASLTGIYRDLAFVLRNVPSFVPFETLPEGAEHNDEIFVAAAVDYYFDGPRLTPGLGAGLQFPSTFETTSINVGGDTIGRTVVIREQGNVSILPVDRTVVPIFQARASLKWDISGFLSAIAWIQFVRDNNGTFVERDPSEGTVALRTFTNANFVGFGTSAQARF